MSTKKLATITIPLILVNFCLIITLAIIYFHAEINTKDEIETVETYTIFVGTNDKDTLKAEFSIEIAAEKVNLISKKYINGFTRLDAEGFWVNDNGKLFM